jgi:hypothetical protein
MGQGDKAPEANQAPSIEKGSLMAWEVLGQIEADNRARVYAQTWGHLAPKPRDVFEGYIVFAVGTHGDEVILDWDFGELQANPWLHTQMISWMGKQIDKLSPRLGDRCFGVWRFEGTYTRLKNGSGRFSGKVYPQRVADRFNRKPHPRIKGGR